MVLVTSKSLLMIKLMAVMIIVMIFTQMTMIMITIVTVLFMKTMNTLAIIVSRRMMILIGITGEVYNDEGFGDKLHNVGYTEGKIDTEYTWGIRISRRVHSQDN